MHPSRTVTEVLDIRTSHGHVRARALGGLRCFRRRSPKHQRKRMLSHVVTQTKRSPRFSVCVTRLPVLPAACTELSLR